MKNDAEYDYADLSRSLQATYEGRTEVYAVAFTSPRVWFYNKGSCGQNRPGGPARPGRAGEDLTS